MKDAVLTIRLSSDLRRRIEALARAEGRSLSQQAGRLIERGMSPEANAPASARLRTRGLSGIFRGERSLTLEDFREARKALSSSLIRRVRADAAVRR
jgi:predicted transcriptional regulator